MTENLISVQQAAKMAGVRPITIWRHARAGNIPCNKIEAGPKRTFYYFSEQDVMEWMAKRK